MKRSILLIVWLVSSIQMSSQNILNEVTFPDTLRSTNDSIYRFIPIWNFEASYDISNNDTIVLESYGNKGNYFKIWTDLDTLRIPYVNHPYKQVVKVPISSPSNESLLILKTIEPINSNFSESYIKNNTGVISFDIPEVYELANVILYLTDCSVNTMNHPTTTYSKRVMEYFMPHINHPLIKILNKNCNDDFWLTYYSFRENSICFSFVENFLEYNSPYKHVYGDPSLLKGGEFRNLLYLIQDFVEQSNFRNFYKDNSNYYNQLISRQRQLLPIKAMWKWLEAEFPIKYDSYKVIFSPLIGGSHSTQKFIRGIPESPEFQECIMFINSPERIDGKTDYKEKLKEGLMSGIVFTEIDHNYVNQTTSRYFNQVNELVEIKDSWASRKVQENYPSESAIFNEYMTHSLFCLFVSERYPNDLAETIIAKRIKLMNRRGFLNFEKFNSILLENLKNRSKTIFEEYPKIIKAMKTLK